MISRLWWGVIRLGFHLLYNQLAFTYDLVSWVVSLGAWRCWGRTALRHLNAEPGALILELAQGTGNLQLDLNAAGVHVVGYDLSPAMGRIAQGKLLRRGWRARLARGRAQALPFPAGAFEGVVSTFPTDFILARETLNEVYRVLKPDGVFVIVPNAVLTGGGLGGRALEGLYRLTGQRGEHTPDDAVARLFMPFELNVIEEACPRSRVTVIVARKSSEKGLETA